MRSAKRIDLPEKESKYDLTEEQEALIEASLDEVERGEYVDGDEVIPELRRRRGL